MNRKEKQEAKAERYRALARSSRQKNATYKKLFNGDSYMVVRVSELDTTPIAIKEFPFGDDMEYAKLCADELVEHLNEKI